MRTAPGRDVRVYVLENLDVPSASKVMDFRVAIARVFDAMAQWCPDARVGVVSRAPMALSSHPDAVLLAESANCWPGTWVEGGGAPVVTLPLSAVGHCWAGLVALAGEDVQNWDPFLFVQNDDGPLVRVASVTHELMAFCVLLPGEEHAWLEAQGFEQRGGAEDYARWVPRWLTVVA